MSMDTVKAAQHIEKHGFGRKQDEAIAQVIAELGWAGLVTRDHLDKRLAQQTAVLAALLFSIAILFKLFV